MIVQILRDTICITVFFFFLLLKVFSELERLKSSMSIKFYLTFDKKENKNKNMHFCDYSDLTRQKLSLSFLASKTMQILKELKSFMPTKFCSVLKVKGIKTKNVRFLELSDLN